MFPVYGFGGKLKSQQKVSHCFALNGNIFKPECNGVDGVLQSYYEAVNRVDLFGGTHFSGILNYVNGFAGMQMREMNQYNQKYTICLIITDGIINDFDKTVEEIVTASELPVSIIIVGVGNADFSQMQDLDGDTNPLYCRNTGKYVARDLVQFVPFREVQNDPTILAKKVLEEVPRQVTEFMQSKGLYPNPKSVNEK